MMTVVVGRPRAFDNVEEFEEKTKQYIEWVKNTPVEKTITANFQGEIIYRKVPHCRPMTQYGWASFLRIGLSTLKDYSKKQEFSAIFEYFQSCMTSWNIDGATSGDLNATLVARIESLADNQKTEHSGKVEVTSLGSLIDELSEDES